MAPHKIVFYDPRGVRMPFARCMVYERGRALTSATTAANALGELDIEIDVRTRGLTVAWCPPETLHDRDEPYHKHYHVELESNPIRHRLANVGFAARLRHEDNVRDYQRAFLLPATGRDDDIAEDLRRRHDDGALTPFVPRPDVEPVVSQTGDEELARALDGPKAFDNAPRALVGDSPSGGSGAKAKQGPGKPGGEPGDGQGGGTGSGTSQQGAVVPNVGTLWLLVGLEPEGAALLDEKDLTVQLLSSQADLSQKPKLIEPTMKGVQWGDIPKRYVLCVFADVPQGTYFALGHAANVKDVARHYALGSVTVTLTSGFATLSYLPLTRDRAILTVSDPLLELEVEPMQRRRKVLATVFVEFPQSAATATAPHDMPPYAQRPYKAMLPGLDMTNTCAPINVQTMNKAGAVGPNFGFGQVVEVKNEAGIVTGVKPRPPFVTYAKGLAPSVGDSFLGTNKIGASHHCGIVIRSSPTYGSLWLTADGGQPDRTSKFMNLNGTWRRWYETPQYPPGSREGAYVLPRRFSQAEEEGRARLGNRFIFPGFVDAPAGDYVSGWTDITHPSVSFKSAYTGNITDADFRAMRRLVLEIGPRIDADIEACTSEEILSSRI